ncbi:hypothetical protein [Desulfobulbus alkaliphilus]|uniref:hypothetical protein n=1 Tax=Desulfobulbus alkaliphilus TaxID=869814 RepID=UPI001963CBA9|nr:hypothetical protein [Desulfobulbus alkaliphilus]MBM9538854.1 hypothetical protein [Desulfobulbus alkaliphilus]
MSEATNSEVKDKISALYDELFGHDGYGRIEVELKILRRGQKEVIIRCGKEYRFVLDYPERRSSRAAADASLPVRMASAAKTGQQQK